jgi:uncharacterized oligopeptide transporter (OPT) family protein
VIAVRRSLGLGSAIYLLIAAVIAILGGLVAQLSIGMLVAFLVYAAFAALVHELIVGLAAMHSGWFPAFAVALITLVIGMLIGFLGGPRRQLGILLATGLLIPFPLAGWAVLAGVICRTVWERFAKAEGMEVFGAGVIAGDALFAFFTSTWKAAFR